MPLRRLLIALVPVVALTLTGCGSAVVSQADLEKQVSDGLERSVGQKLPGKLTCPGDLIDPTAGTSVHCTLQLSESSQVGVTVTVTSVDGLNVKYDIKVDDTPTPAPTT